MSAPDPEATGVCTFCAEVMTDENFEAIPKTVNLGGIKLRIGICRRCVENVVAADPRILPGWERGIP